MGDSRGGKSETLASLSAEYWEARLANNPVMATAFGDRRFDDRLAEITPAGVSRMVKQYDSFLSRCDTVPSEQLGGPDRVTLAALRVDVASERDYLASQIDEWAVDPLGGPQVEFQNIESYQPVRSPAEGRAMAARWRAMGPYFDDKIANLRLGAAQGRVATRPCVEKVVGEIEDLLSRPQAEWALLRPLAEERKGWSEEERQEFASDLASAVKDSAGPGFARYLATLRSEILPRSRPQDRPGMMHVPGGAEGYVRLIKVHTSLGLTPEELHQTGLREVARINAETVKLGEKVFGVGDRKEILKRLRTDSSLYFSTRDEVEDKAAKALARAKAAIPKWFGRLPKTDCEVVRMEEHEEKNSTIAYYRQPAADGSRPGRYYINTSEPETRPRYEAEALAYHESIPGHHLQIAIAQELVGIPEFRKFSGVTAFVEGWGLYSERLSDEMGLYSSDLDRIGVLSYDSWRACRLVVDTGMHAYGWSREEAINFMLENSALAKNNVVNEVDRYISWPGQALAYKTGQLEMMRLRRETEARLGPRFDIKRFHDTLLGNGGLPLEALRQVVETAG